MRIEPIKSIYSVTDNTNNRYREEDNQNQENRKDFKDYFQDNQCGKVKKRSLTLNEEIMRIIKRP